MNRQILYSATATKGVDRVMEPEQFTQVIEAILAGKYSWACVLILRFAGYNPLHYIPYRTYNRLVKDNKDLQGQHQYSPNQSSGKSYSESGTKAEASPRHSHSIQDLAYLENLNALNQEFQPIRGGRFVHWLGSSLKFGSFTIR